MVLTVRRPCSDPACAACRAGRQDFCLTGGFTERGIRGAHGYMTERVLEEERYLVPVPAALREVAVLIEPLTIAVKSLAQVGAIDARLPAACRHSPASPHRALVLGTVNAGRDHFDAAARDLGVFVSRWPDAVRGLITGRFPLERALEPLSGRAGGIKSVIAVGE